jgi:hypothetical protein
MNAAMRRPRPPAAVKWAAAAMLAGAVVTLGWGVLFALQQLHPPGPPPPEGYAQISLFFGGIFLGVVGSVPWLETALLALAGRERARTWSAVYFGLYFVVSFVLLVNVYSRANPNPPPLVDGLLGPVLEWLCGLAALVLLGRPAATRFFRARAAAGTGSEDPSS